MAQEKRSGKGGGKASKFARRLEGGAGSAPPAETSRPPAGRRERTAPERTIRVTVDLPRDEHRFLRILAAESGSDGMRVMRAFLQEAAEHEDFASRVRERLLAEEA